MTDIDFPALNALEDRIKAIFAEAGDDHDLTKVVSLKGTTAEKLAAIKELNAQRDELLKVLDAARGNAPGSREHGSEPDSRKTPAAGVAGQARSVIDAAVKSGLLPDHAAEKATGLVEHGSAADMSLAARWVLAAGDPHYLTAFAKTFIDPRKGHLLWTPAEQAAYRAVKALDVELKAPMGTGAGAGAELIPLTLDPTILLTSAGSINPLRRISRVEQTVTNQWQGVTSAGATAEWKTEHAQAAEATVPTADEPVPLFFGDAFTPFSYELELSAVNLVSQLGRVLTDAADQLQAAAYTTGTGTGQPAGVVTGATTVNNAAGVFVAADIYTLQNSLPPRFSDRAQWAANLAVINAMSQFETTNGALKFPELRESPARLLQKPLHELSNMSGDFSTTGSKFLLYGDFAQFVIVDRIGTRVDRIENIFGANGRPTGQRGAFMWFMTGSRVLIPGAIKALVKTA